MKEKWKCRRQTRRWRCPGDKGYWYDFEPRERRWKKRSAESNEGCGKDEEISGAGNLGWRGEGVHR